MCAAAGHTEISTVVNHRIPHRGDQTLFWEKANWEGTCGPHHDQIVEPPDKAPLTGVTREGRPTDPAHP
jgi:5-methylcytosine-specific restriction enzyme A